MLTADCRPLVGDAGLLSGASICKTPIPKPLTVDETAPEGFLSRSRTALASGGLQNNYASFSLRP